MEKEPEDKELVNYVGEAFRLPINIGFVLVAAITMIVAFFLSASDILSPNIPLLIALLSGMAEMIYLSYMPRNERFIRRVNAKHGKEADNIDRQLRSFDLLQKLDRNSVSRYMQFYQNKQQISENLLKSPVSIDFSYVDKLNQLEAYYVELLHSIDRYENTSADSGLPNLDREIEKIKREIEQSDSQKVRQVYQKRLSLLEKRKGKASDMKENLEVARVQVDAVEDAIHILLHDTQNINNPSRVLSAIDEVIGQAEIHSDTLQELDFMMNDFSFPEISENENTGDRTMN